MHRIEKTLVDACKKLYGENLAAVLIFGSYFTGNYNKEESDLDTIILFKKEPNRTKEEL
ncbi:MAG: nucleotidyltransferase domain-containing protein [Nanoarchaeota archaeon]|nr:nucleotidyltransferase domain-containing protein [Nanoarchaeota archaeon]MBU0977437.1 nucleotidyltransferase domain-containing protein [Nanoarchaeota archaeon]